MSNSLAQFVNKRIDGLVWGLDQRGISLDDLHVNYSAGVWDEERLFDILKLVDTTYQHIRTPCEAIMGDIWLQICQRTTKARRGYLIRQKFGDNYGPSVMRRLSQTARVIRYWRSIEEGLEVDVPWWIYEECALGSLPASKAIEFVANYKKGEKFKRETIRSVAAVKVQEELGLDVLTIQKPTIESLTNICGFKNQNGGDRIPVLEEQPNLWQGTPTPQIPADDRLITFTVSIPKRTERAFDQEAKRRGLSVTGLMNELAVEFAKKADREREPQLIVVNDNSREEVTA